MKKGRYVFLESRHIDVIVEIQEEHESKKYATAF